MRIGSALCPGEINILDIVVTSLAANLIRDLDRRGETWRAFEEINVVNMHDPPCEASGSPAAPSGPLGPVTLTPLRVTTSGEHESDNIPTPRLGHHGLEVRLGNHAPRG